MQDASESLQKGMTGKITEEVTGENVASKCGSGELDVYGTPYMIAAMERSAVSAVDDSLPDGWITVGIAVDVSHLAVTPIGGEITVEAELKKVDGKKLIFSVEASDDKEMIGKGTHQRYCVHKESFLDNAAEKLKK